MRYQYSQWRAFACTRKRGTPPSSERPTDPRTLVESVTIRLSAYAARRSVQPAGHFDQPVRSHRPNTTSH